MNIKLALLGMGILGMISCEEEFTGPETDCSLGTFYKLDHHHVRAARAYDVRTNLPTRLFDLLTPILSLNKVASFSIKP